MTDYENLKELLVRVYDDQLQDQEAGIPRRHFLILSEEGIEFRLEPDGSLAEVSVLPEYGGL
jgi:hypothetical protein